jgi:hypothetical protein
MKNTRYLKHRITSVLLVFVLMFSIVAVPDVWRDSGVVIEAGASSSVANATAYARANALTGRSGESPLCAEFTFNVLRAGGYTMPTQPWNGMNIRTVAYAQYEFFRRQGVETIYLGHGAVSQNAHLIEEGDLVFWDQQNRAGSNRSNNINFNYTGTGGIPYTLVEQTA